MNKYTLLFLQTIALIVFVSFIPMLLLFEDSTSVVWTIVIPILPIIFILLGYSNWRNVCPLAFFSKISQKLSWIPKRKVPIWFEKNFYFFQYFLLLMTFSSRFLILNSNSIFLALFFIAIIVISFLTNLIYTGKSWCNFFCPVGLVEKLYCVSNSHKSNLNSACSSCSACKKNCPDIDMESNYWKENENRQKTVVFYSFSGLILGFYLYFYLQSGSFSYYYLGEWTDKDMSIFSAGFFFAPFIPIFIAAPLTLILFSAISFYFFKGVEQYLYKSKFFGDISYATLTHRVKVVSAFVAFNIFYIFAGAPTYMHYPILYSIFYFIVVVMSAIVLHKEFFREESFFLQERFALKMIKRWDSNKPIPTNLKEIYYTYRNENRNKKEQLKTYKETIRDLLQEGILSQNSMSVLEKLRVQMGISESDHLNIINSIKLDNKELFDTNIEKSAEKRYQRKSYKSVLEDTLAKNIELDKTALKSLQKQFCITDSVHKQIMSDILNSDDKLYAKIINLLKEMNYLRRIHKSILNDRSPQVFFLKYVIRNEFSLISKELFRLLHILYKDYNLDINRLEHIFKYRNIGTKIELQENSLDFMDEKIAKEIFQLKKDFDSIKEVKEVEDNAPVMKYLLENNSITIATATLLNAMNYGDDFLSNINMDRFTQSEDAEIKALAYKIILKTNNLTSYERMMYLHNIPLFESIKFNYLRQLANSTQVVRFKAGEYIIEQGGVAHTLFIITSGSVVVEIDGKITDTLGSEEYFGAVAIIADRTRIASVKSITNVTMLTLSKRAFKEFLFENPKISVKLMKEVVTKLLEK